MNIKATKCEDLKATKCEDLKVTKCEDCPYLHYDAEWAMYGCEKDPQLEPDPAEYHHLCPNKGKKLVILYDK